jgi:alanyl-tRNA synthetase
MSSAKEKLRKRFSASPDKYYRVELFREKGFARKRCPKCGGYFWTLDPDRKTCPNPPCEPYGFIGNPQAKRKLGYIETWRLIERFFRKEGHESVPSYPVTCRWFPGLYFTVASIVAFQRSIFGKTVFEMPANPLIIPQNCLRFIDIPNVGVTGRHMTNFVMVGQHSIYEKGKGYWKDRCIELDFRLLTEAFGIRPELINFLEEVWVGPSAFGYSLEYFVKGLELGNAVFTEFVGTPEKYRKMEQKVIDMGAGLERFAWITQGTPTAYDAVFGPVVRKLKGKTDYDRRFYSRYAALAGNLNMDEVPNIRAAKELVAKQLGVGVDSLIEKTSRMEALYAIADHSKTLLLAITDGALPSNVSGGYNLRVVLRRALGFIEEFGLDLDLADICREHARFLKPLNPKLMENLDEVEEILKVEKERFGATRKRARNTIQALIKRGEKPDNEKLIELYESQGITPELIQEEAGKEKRRIEIPANFYQQISEKHMQEKGEERPPDLDVEGLPGTEILFYKSPRKREFTARVLKIEGDWVMLDKTLFYPEGGGQTFDLGFIGDRRVLDVQKFGNVIAHKVEKPPFRKGQVVKGRIDWPRRLQLMQHHTAIHVINGAARRVLGGHVWQAGSGKTPDKAHLDITHYQGLSQEEVEGIENLANQVVRKGLRVESLFLPRAEAEKRFGMRIYQGGAIPDSTIRIISTRGFDVEACAGTHLSSTRDIGRIVILSSERIQDGVDRITIKAGRASEDYGRENLKIARELMNLIRRDLHFVGFSPGLLKSLKDPFRAIRELQAGAGVFSVQPGQIQATLKKFCREIVDNTEKLRVLRRQLKMERKGLRDYLKARRFSSLQEICESIFSAWKLQAKELENLRKQAGRARAENLIKKARKGEVFEVLEGDRRELISIAEEVLQKNPGMTVILANQSGDIVGMSRTRDMGRAIKELCEKAGGSGGGKPRLGQGRAKLARFLKIMGFDMRIAGRGA